MVQGFNQVKGYPPTHVKRGVVPEKTWENKSERQPEGDMLYAPHQGKGKMGKSKSSVGRKVSDGGTAVT